MARRVLGSPKFDRPDGYILNMLLFLLAVGGIVYYLSPWSPQPSPLLVDAFNANPALNGLILGVLLLGIFYNLIQAEMVSPSMKWLEAFAEVSDRNRSRLPREPRLIKAVSKILVQSDGRLSPESTRAILDSIGTRMDEARETGRYMMNLLVFLGLLGTFWGLLQTVNAVAETINGLAATSGPAEEAVAQLITNLQEPLSGMGTAFSSSLFGLGGSLVVGFLDLQAGQAQNRFYSGLEDWLAENTESTRAPGASASYDGGADNDLIGALQALETALAANTETQIKASAGQTAELKDEIRALNRTLIRVGGGDRE